jgi:hypothetical protein
MLREVGVTYPDEVCVARGVPLAAAVTGLA